MVRDGDKDPSRSDGGRPRGGGPAAPRGGGAGRHRDRSDRGTARGWGGGKISSFGSFSVRDKAPRWGRNPKTGEPALIGARRVVVFKPSPTLKRRIDRALSDAGDGV